MECVHFHIASHCFCFISSLNSKNCFFHSTALHCVLFGVFHKTGVFTNPSCTIKRRKRTKKKNMESDSPRGLFGTGSCLSLLFFYYGSALLFLSDANIGKWINWKKYIHLDKAFFSFAFSLTGRVLENFWDKIGKPERVLLKLLCFLPFFLSFFLLPLLFFSTSTFFFF